MQWIRGCCPINGCPTTGKGSYCSYCKDAVQNSIIKGNSNAINSTPETWANIVWGNNKTIGCGATIIHTETAKYLLVVINYATPPDTSGMENWAINMVYACTAQSTKFKLNKKAKTTAVCEVGGKNLCLSSGGAEGHGCIMQRSDTETKLRNI